jgi:lipopolysaccharide cholinephosphotransferase
MNEKVAIEALKQVKEVFDKHGIEYWLDYGTLLGAVRDGKFIPWDSDVDLATWQKNFDKIIYICKEFCDKGFEVYFSDQKNSILVVKKDCKIDITFYYLNSDNGEATHTCLLHADRKIGQIIDYMLWVLKLRNAEAKESRAPLSITKKLVKSCSLMPTWLRKKLIHILRVLYEKIGSTSTTVIVPSHYFTNLSTIKFYGMEFKVPAETEEYLAYRYGKNWRTPQKNYKYWKDDGAICQPEATK